MADKGHSAVEVSGRPVDFANRETAKGPVSKFPVVNHRPQGTAFEADTGRSTSEVGTAQSASFYRSQQPPSSQLVETEYLP